MTDIIEGLMKTIDNIMKVLPTMARTLDKTVDNAARQQRRIESLTARVEALEQGMVHEVLQ